MSKPSVQPQSQRSTESSAYERRDANAKWIFGIVAFLLLAGLVMHFCLAGVMERFEKKPEPSDRWTAMRRDTSIANQNNNVPHLQVAPAEDLKRFQAQQATELSTYGWINRTAGIVRLPIERAMDLALERGFAVRSATNQNTLGPSSYELQQQRPQQPQPEIQERK